MSLPRLIAVSLLTLGVICPGPTDTESVEMESVSDHVLLRLEEDDVHLGCKQAAQHNEAAQAHRDAHGGGLHLGESGSESSDSEWEALKCSILETLSYNSRRICTSAGWLSLA